MNSSPFIFSDDGQNYPYDYPQAARENAKDEVTAVGHTLLTANDDGVVELAYDVPTISRLRHPLVDKPVENRRTLCRHVFNLHAF